MREPKTWQAYMRLMRDALRAMRPIACAPVPGVIRVEWDDKFVFPGEWKVQASKAA